MYNIVLNQNGTYEIMRSGNTSIWGLCALVVYQHKALHKGEPRCASMCQILNCENAVEKERFLK